MSEKVSVIIPTKNRIDATLRCLESVKKQNLSPYEIIVVDDGSTDGTSKKIKKEFPDVKILKNETSMGGAVARNQGVDLATGDFVAFLDSDDEWLPNHLSNTLKLIELENTEASFGTFLLKKGKIEKPAPFYLGYERKNNIGNLILSSKRFDARTSTLVFRREAFLKIRFDENLKKHQDWDLAINFDREFNFVFDKEPTVRIYVEQEEVRMSQKLDHPSSFFFIHKNAHLLDSNNIFLFCVRQIMRSQLAGDAENIIQDYLSVTGQYYFKLTLTNKLLYKILRAKIINLGTIYRLVSKIKS